VCFKSIPNDHDDCERDLSCWVPNRQNLGWIASAVTLPKRVVRVTAASPPSALQGSYPWFVHRDMFGTRSHIGQPIREPRFHQYVMLLW
jgi:hypothetical protein